MTTRTQGAKTFPKTFPRQPKWNAGGAIGTLTGLLISPGMSGWLGTDDHTTATAVVGCAVIGGLIGILLGAVADRGQRPPGDGV